VLRHCCRDEHPAYRKLSDEVLLYVSVWSEVQIICIWSSRCQCHPSSLASLKSGIGLPFWFWLTEVVLEKRPLNEFSSSSSSSSSVCSKNFQMLIYVAVAVHCAKHSYCFIKSKFL